MVVMVTGVTVAAVFCYLGYRAATGPTTVGIRWPLTSNAA